MLEILRENGLQLLLDTFPHGPLGGLALTLLVAVAGLLLALPTGLLIAWGLISPWRVVRLPLQALVFYIRSVPLLLHILWAYFLLPLAIGRTVSGPVTVLVTLLIFNGAYLSQVLRAGIRAVPPGQTQAAQALGFSYLATLRLVVLPQALRNVVPSIVSQLVLLIKETALGAVIGMTELMQQFMELADRHHEYTLQIYLLLGVSYFLLCYPLALAGRRLETQRNRAKA